MKKTDVYEINRELVLSTGHIPWSDAEIFDKIPEQEHLQLDYWWMEVPAFGYRILIADEIEAEILQNGRSVALLYLVRLARKLKCKWLVLDPDGPLRDDLPKFDW